jgi:ubiquinone/menaquinone biosynthesis C-methylase UbiE
MRKRRLPPPEYWSRSAAEFDAIYTRNKGRFAVWLDSVLRRDMFERYEFALAACRPVEGRTFLDVGCGTGLYSLALARENAAKVVGVDFSGEMVRICRDRAGAEGLKNAEFIRGDILALDRPGVFDVSLAVGLFDYTQDPAAVVRKIRAATGEKLIASFPRAGTLRAFLRRVRLARRGCAVYFYTREDVYALLAQSGFAVEDFRRLGQLFCVSAGPRSGRP